MDKNEVSELFSYNIQNSKEDKGFLNIEHR